MRWFNRPTFAKSRTKNPAHPNVRRCPVCNRTVDKQDITCGCGAFLDKGMNRDPAKTIGPISILPENQET